MSELQILNNDKGQPEKGYLKGVTLCYIKLQDGAFKYGSKTEKEYVLDAVVDKATAKAWKKLFSKNTPKEIDTDEFEAKFKIAPPFPEQEEQFVIKMKAGAQFTTDLTTKGQDGEEMVHPKGTPIPYEWNNRPKMFVRSEGGVKDVTMSLLASNGSVGDISFKVVTNEYGTFPKFNGVLVTDLIEYKSSGGSGNASPFGEIEGGLNAGDGDTQQKASAGQQEEQDKATPTASGDDFDDGSELF